MAGETDSTMSPSEDKMASRIIEMGRDLFRDGKRCFIRIDDGAGTHVESCNSELAAESNAEILSPQQVIDLSGNPGVIIDEKHLSTARVLVAETKASEAKASEAKADVQQVSFDREKSNKLFMDAVEALFDHENDEILNRMVAEAAALGKVITRGELADNLKRHFAKLSRVIDAFLEVGDPLDIDLARRYHVQNFATYYDFSNRGTIAMYSVLIQSGGGLAADRLRTRNIDNVFHTKTYLREDYIKVKNLPPLYDKHGKRVFLCHARTWNLTDEPYKLGRGMTLDGAHPYSISMALVREPSPEEM